MITRQTILDSSTFFKKENKVELTQFSLDDLSEKANALRGKIVEFNMKSNSSSAAITNIIAFISLEGKNWRGLEMNFLFQQNVMNSSQLQDLANSLEHLQNLESLILAFGSIRVSLLHALKDKRSGVEWSKVNPFRAFNLESLKRIVESITRVLQNNSTTLRQFGLDFHGQTHAQNILPELGKMNEALQQCVNLEIYEFSLNHTQMSGRLIMDKFFDSFEFLKGKTQLRVFTLNICDWSLEISHFYKLGNIFGEFLGQDNAPALEKFSLDHSASIMLPSVSPSPIQAITEGIISMISSHQRTLKELHICFNSYNLEEGQLSHISNIFSPLSNCDELKIFSLRLYGWKPKSKLEQSKFLQEMLWLLKLKQLSFFNFESFKSFSFNNLNSLKANFLAIITTLKEKYAVRMRMKYVKLIQQNLNFKRIEISKDILDKEFTKILPPCCDNFFI